ncbi:MULTISPECIES: hypothetical protein [unclassified Aureispira]|uniref:hypothetical protein n=1 Tax=unclassified Aureispira TaxID=2649989 RepID=UPI0006984FA2|nr:MULTISPECIES: hypothetical protein [unclassified Aureispira]WMX16040.1 hypothetical protein QP953_06645 [Aureispira sp. CCB-E]
MEVGFFVLGLIAILGTFSLYRNGQKNKLIHAVINDFLDKKNGLLVGVDRPNNSGPFEDEYYDHQGDNLYQNLGYQNNETVYRKVAYQTSDGSNKQAWVQIRIENLKVTYIEWKE